MTSDNDSEKDIDPERRTAIKSAGFFGAALTGFLKNDSIVSGSTRDRIQKQWRAGGGHGRGKWCWSCDDGHIHDQGKGYDRNCPHFEDKAQWRSGKKDRHKKGKPDETPREEDPQEDRGPFDPQDPEQEPDEEPDQEPDEEPDEEPDQEPDEEPDDEPDEEPDDEPDEEPDDEPDEEPDEEPDDTDVPSDVVAQIEMRIHEEVNAYRQSNGLSPLAFNDELAAVARDHSQDMNDRNYFSHTSPDGEDPGDRVDEAGVDCDAWGENIAFEYDPSFSEEDADSVAESIVNGWINSPGHRQNILGNYDEQGIGVDISDDGEVMATQLFCSTS